MSRAFDRDALVAALEEIGRQAASHGETVEMLVYGGSALMLASNFRWSSEDVDVAPLDPWPEWLTDAVHEIAEQHGWRETWLDDAVGTHLSPAADRQSDHLFFGSFPRGAAFAGLRVYVPTAAYLLALKLKAIRVLDPAKGAQEAADIRALLAVCRIHDIEEAIAVLGRYFPRSAADAAKQRFLLRHLMSSGDVAPSPAYPLLDDEPDRGG